MNNNGSMTKVLSQDAAQDYVQNVLHMDKVTLIKSSDTDYWFFKGLSESYVRMEVRIERKPDKNKLHNVAERIWTEQGDDTFGWIDALPERNAEPSDNVDEYLPG